MLHPLSSSPNLGPAVAVGAATVIWFDPHHHTVRARPESDLLAQVVDLAALHGWRTYHTHDSRRCDPGFPDLVLVRAGRLLALELKSAHGRLTEPQRAWLVDLRRGGAEVGVAGPGDLGLIAHTLRTDERLARFDPGPEPLMAPAQARATVRRRPQGVPSRGAHVTAGATPTKEQHL